MSQSLCSACADKIGDLVEAETDAIVRGLSALSVAALGDGQSRINSYLKHGAARRATKRRGER